METAFGSACVSQRNERLLWINHDMSWSEMFLNIQRRAIFCRTGGENQINNWECSPIQYTKMSNESFSNPMLSLRKTLKVSIN